VHAERHADVEAFLARAGGFLADREAEHNLIFGLSSTLARDPHAYGSDPYLVTVEDEGRVVAAALRTPPHNLVLSESDDDRVWAAFAVDAHAVDPSLTGVLAPVVGAVRFVEAWRGLTGAEARPARSQRIYRIDAVSDADEAPGSMRSFAAADRPLALGWLEAFFEEEFDASDPVAAEKTLHNRVSDPQGGVVLWSDDGMPVSLAGFGGPTPNGIRIGPVYTPPNLRRRGYATALTAALTRSLLERHRFCFLFTDLANPTSNGIYMRIGYVPVADVEEWRFAYRS
jgi:predicted GNAT family acetyltransferase